MRIKKKHIQEDIEKAQKLADKEVENIGNIAKDIEGAVSNIAGDDEADEMSSKIAKSAIDLAYAGGEDVNEGDDAVDRGIEAGINPEVEPKNLDNAGDGQKGGPDYGQEEDPSKLVKGDLPFDESVDKQISEGDDNIHSRIQALKVQIARTKDPKKLASLKDWLGKEEKLAANKTNESVKVKMSKDQLIETVLGNQKREVIKTFKVKDLRK